MTLSISFGLLCWCFFMSSSDLLPKCNWLRRVCTVSKLHQWWAALLSLMVLLVQHEMSPLMLWVSLAMTLFVLLNNGLALVKYLPFYPKRIQTGRQNDFKILALNVRQKNTDYGRALKTIRTENADVIALTETNRAWAEALSELDEAYPYQVKVPLENTYGMILISKHEISKHEVRYLVNDEIPSIHAYIQLKGQMIHLMLIHPEPPLDLKRLKEKDLEILMVSIEAEETPLPTILCGDLNDVGWSYASQHMCSQTHLEDPRIGRGFFNTYNAHIPFFRYPIDHFFMSPQLKLVDMKVLDKCGSDHFPVSISLELPK